MHVRVRYCGEPDKIVVVDSKLTTIDTFRKIIKEKFGVKPDLQRLLYGGKLLENGYTFHDYNIKLNDVIQLMVKVVIKDEPKVDKIITSKDSKTEIKESDYEDVKSNLYELDDLVDMKDEDNGAWFEGRVVRIVKDPKYKPEKKEKNCEKIETECETNEMNGEAKEEKSETTPTRKKGITDYFTKAPKGVKRKSELFVKDDFNCDTSTDVGVLYKIKLLDEEDCESAGYYCKLSSIRPRARNEINVDDLIVGETVMINYNVDEPHEKGFWYDFKVNEINKQRKSYELVGTIYLGEDSIPQDDTKVKLHDKIFRIETVVPLKDRTEDIARTMKTPVDKRAAPLKCTKCRDDPEKECRQCGCFVCAGKEKPEKIILCDECEHGYHLWCLTPPLDDLPDDDWYCDDCRTDRQSVIAPGAGKQKAKGRPEKGKRDWGRGMACVGKTQSSSMPPNHFGPIPGIEVGMTWRFRIQLSESGVHRPPVSGIHGRDVEGAYSLVLSGGYEDDVDHGYEFTYTGSGGRDLSGNKRTAEQSCDQTLTRENKALARNCCVKEVSEKGGDAGEDWKKGRPVRVVRSYKMLKHFPKYAPSEGIRYDGIYKVVKYYPEKGKAGFIVWKYLLRRDDPSPAPWEEGAKHYDIVYPEGYLEAEAEKKALKEKQNKKTKKRVLKERNSLEVEDKVESPPSKKRKTRSVVEQSPKTPKSDAKDATSKSPKADVNPFTLSAKKKKKSIEKSRVLEDVVSKEELELVRADVVNKKHWEECLDVAEKNGRQQFIAEVTKVFLCIICQDVAANPVTTVCHHNFCLSCLKLAFKSTESHKCSYCRADLKNEELAINEDLRKALHAFLPGYDVGKK